MANIRQYILTVTSAALISAVLIRLVGKKGTVAELVKLICGLFLAVTVISPILRIDLQKIVPDLGLYSDTAAQAVAQGENYAREETERIIKARAEEYIVNKAKALNASVSVWVTLKDGLPHQVSITGALSPYAKAALSRIITQEIGIESEAQDWRN